MQIRSLLTKRNKAKTKTFRDIQCSVKSTLRREGSWKSRHIAAHHVISPPGLLAGILEFSPVANWMTSAVAIISIGAMTHAHWIWTAVLIRSLQASDFC